MQIRQNVIEFIMSINIQIKQNAIEYIVQNNTEC